MPDSPITFSVFTKPWKTQSLGDLCALVHDMGFDGVELSLAGPLPASLDEPALLKRQRAMVIFPSEASRSAPARISATLRLITTYSCHWRCRIDPLYRP